MANTTKRKRKQAAELWKKLQAFVRKGGHRLLMTAVDAEKASQPRLLKLPTDFHLKDSDTAGDKFLKLVAYQVNQKREARKKPLTDEEKLMMQKDEEAYLEALKCLMVPLTSPVTATKSKKESTSCDSLLMRTSPEFFKLFRHRLKEIIRSAHKVPDKSHTDIIFYNSLVEFYDKMSNERCHQLIANGSTYGDISGMFTKIFETSAPSLSTAEISEKTASISSLARECCEKCFEDKIIVKDKFQSMNRQHKQGSSIPDVIPNERGRIQQCNSVPASLDRKSVTTSLQTLQGCFDIKQQKKQKMFNAISLSRRDIAQEFKSQFEERLKALESNSIESMKSKYQGITFNDEKMLHNWLLHEKDQLLKHSVRIQKHFLDVPLPGERKKQGPQRMRVKLMQARNLTKKNSKSNIYASVTCGNENFQTTPVQNSLDPIWEQEIELDLTEEAAEKREIKILLWDSCNDGRYLRKLLHGDEHVFMGQVSLNMGDLFQQLKDSPEDELNLWLQLEKRSKRSHVSGDIQVVCRLSNSRTAIANSINTSSLSILPKSNQKFAFFGNYNDVYRHICGKMLAKDGVNTIGRHGEGSLSSESEAILKEVAEHWRISSFYQVLIYLETALDRFRESMTQVVIGHPNIHTVTNLVHWAWKQLSPYCENNVLDSVSSALESIFRKLANHLSWQIQRYSDCFPCNTPNGALHASLRLMKYIYENPIGAQSLLKSISNDSGIDASESEETCTSHRLSFAEIVGEIVMKGALDRYQKLDELSTPIDDDPLNRLTKLCELALVELNSDKKHFEKTFIHNDLALLSHTASIILKHIYLELDTFFTDMKTRPSPDLTAFVERKSGLLFQLYHHVATLQKDYLPTLLVEGFAEHHAFSVHRFFTPFLEEWMTLSERRMLEWVQSAFEQDTFLVGESMGVDPTMRVSSSVDDLFFCSKQIRECLLKLDWVHAGGEPVPVASTADQGDDEEGEGSEVEEEMTLRKITWYQFETRYSRILARSIKKYCDLLRKSEESLFRPWNTHKPDVKPDAKPDTKAKHPPSSTASEPPTTTEPRDLSEESRKRICVKLNNLELIRHHLNTIYDQLDVDGMTAFLQEHTARQQKKKEKEKEKQAVQSPSTKPNRRTLMERIEEVSMSGYLTLDIVRAENLTACDVEGTSDPYCVVSVREVDPKKVQALVASGGFGGNNGNSGGVLRSRTAPTSASSNTDTLNQESNTSLEKQQQDPTSSSSSSVMTQLLNVFQPDPAGKKLVRKSKTHLHASQPLSTSSTTASTTITTQPPPSSQSTTTTTSTNTTTIDLLTLTTKRELARTPIQNTTLEPHWDAHHACRVTHALAFEVVVYDHDVVGLDDVCGRRGWVFSPAGMMVSLVDGEGGGQQGGGQQGDGGQGQQGQWWKDGLVHDVWVGLEPQGMVLLRVQVEGSGALFRASPGTHGSPHGYGHGGDEPLLDSRHYFRMALREVKRCSGDVMGLLSGEVLQSRIHLEVGRLLMACWEKEKGMKEREGKEGNSGGGLFTSLFGSHPSSTTSPSSTTIQPPPQHPQEEILPHLLPLTNHLNETLHLYAHTLHPHAFALLLRRIWENGVLCVLERVVLPPLFGRMRPSPLPLPSLGFLGGGMGMGMKGTSGSAGAGVLSAMQIRWLEVCLEVVREVMEGDTTTTTQHNAYTNSNNNENNNNNAMGLTPDQIETQLYWELRGVFSIYGGETGALMGLYTRLGMEEKEGIENASNTNTNTNNNSNNTNKTNKPPQTHTPQKPRGPTVNMDHLLRLLRLRGLHHKECRRFVERQVLMRFERRLVVEGVGGGGVGGSGIVVDPDRGGRR